MEIYYSKLIGARITKKGKVIGKFKKIFINRETGKLIAIQAVDKSFIPWESIIEIKDQIRVKNKGRQEFEEKNNKAVDLIEKQVNTQGGKKLGTVRDIVIDEYGLSLKRILVVKKILFFDLDQRLIPSDSIIEIKKNKVIVKEDSLLNRYRLKKPFFFKKQEFVEPGVVCIK